MYLNVIGCHWTRRPKLQLMLINYYYEGIMDNARNILPNINCEMQLDLGKQADWIKFELGQLK
ncbi:hypothetical protein SLEP1_g29064 [Rubroshorea leprosula]|uniref:Uncharacterized protein n=1 Tax=Rubroshorea leprosula TaxID=152421 RepID=A0AAV5K577_9ROSI|nr:hypothetical protein SLEP1_g29064 [Rubroshorea leprosula]